jgi:glucose/arabinose dehydrogenase
VQKGDGDNQYRLTAEGGQLRFEIAGRGAATAVLPSTGVWHHVAGTYDGSAVKLYIDGAVAASVAASGAIPTTTNALFIGTKNAAAPAGDHFLGRIDDVRVYNVALPVDDIANLAGIININFQPAASAVPAKYLVDGGNTYGPRGNGFSYGWNINHTDVVRDRGANADQRLDTLSHFHAGGVWEIGLPTGSYEVIASIGDPTVASTHTLNVEGITFASSVSLAANQFQTIRGAVNVTDGRLTINQGAAAEMATRINYVQILALDAQPNNPPNTPAITEPHVDGQIVNPADVHMEAPNFSDPDPGDAHASSDWEIHLASTDEIIWQAPAITGIEKVHIHLGDGQFVGSHAGRTEMLPLTNYVLRVRHRDNRGAVSGWATRSFATSERTATIPLSLDDVLATPTPTFVQASGGAAVELPVGTSMTLGSAAGDVLLRFDGLATTGNTITNPAALPAHVAARVAFGATSAVLSLPQTNLTFTEGGGTSYTVYLPAVSLSIGQSAYFWVGADGSTYVATAQQTTPNFDTPARVAPVPFTLNQPGYAIDVFASNFQLPTNIAFVPNPGPNPNDVFFYVTELYGTIKVVTRDGNVGNYATNLLNFNPTGNFPGSGEQGVSGIVVDPITGDVFATMIYSSQAGVEAAPHYPKIVRFHSTDGGHTAATQSIVLQMPGETMGQSHFISNISIGPSDGKLWVHVGDGFDATRGQDLNSFRGKLLRMNFDGTAVPDNPFYNAADGITSRDYVYSYGLRNPFGGNWRQLDGKHYEVENGPSIDRMAQYVPGRNYLYDGSDASMLNFAIYNWNPSHAPVNMLFIQSGTFLGSAFPGAKFDHLFVAESGPTYATGPQSLGKRITEFTLDANGNRLTGPTDFLTYTGSGKGSVVALAAGPDGIYFSELYKDQNFSSPIDRGARIFRVRYINSVAPTVTVNALATNDRTPPLSGTVSLAGATIQVTVNGITYNATNNGNGTWSLADNVISPALADGTYDVRVTATSLSNPIGVDATSNELVIDNVAPTASNGAFAFLVSPTNLTIQFSENVSASLSLADIAVQNLTTSATFNPTAVSYIAATNTATFTFPAGVIPDGNYRSTLTAGGVTDTAGNMLAQNFLLDFFFLGGDANHDGTVNLTDFNVLASNFGQSNRNYSQGDFNYDGLVNLSDFNVLASRFGQSVARGTFGATRIGETTKNAREIDALRDELLG